MSFGYRGRGGYGRGGGGGGYPRERGRAAHNSHSDQRSTAACSDGDSDGGGGCGSITTLQAHLSNPPTGQSCDALLDFLHNADGGNYGQLKQLTGQTFALTPARLPDSSAVTVRFLRIQSDPFAPGSQLCLTLPAPFPTRSLLCATSSTTVDDGPATTAATERGVTAEDAAWRRVAVEDFILRCLHRGLSQQNSGSDAVQLLRISPHVLPRSAVQLVDQEGGEGFLHLFLRVKLPGHGRRIDGRGIHRILFFSLLPVVQAFVQRCDHDALWTHVTAVSDQVWLRRQLRPAGLVAFIADGSVLPRAAGDSGQPMNGPAVVAFSAPPSLTRTFTLPYSKRVITGAGLPHGLTLIAGGGFHGKSTLLRALELGVYNHVPDDGRAFVVVDPTAVKIRAEDRRSVHGVDISPFITNLPQQKDTTAFVTGDASGSASQATNIMEALELGATALLLDEDTSATNFMYRDAMMEALVPPQQEPITSFVHRVRDLVDHHGVSVILVVGGSGQYFAKADVVLVMNAYRVHDATAHAREIVQRGAAANSKEKFAAVPDASAFHFPPQRHFCSSESFEDVARRSRSSRGLKVSGVGTGRVRVGEEDVELALVEQLVEEGQVNAIAQCLAMLFDEGSGSAEQLQRAQVDTPVYPPPLWTPTTALLAGSTPRQRGLSDFGRLLHNCERRLRMSRLELQTPSCYLPAGFTALPRVFELGAALNRLRTLITARR